MTTSTIPPRMLEAREIGGVPIFRPSEACEAFVYRHVKARLFEQYASGTYTDIAQVTRIVNAQFESYDQLLQAYLPKVDHLEFIAFLIQQYEQYGLAHNVFQRGNMSDDDEELWRSYAMNSRRGIKYLMELVCARGWSGGTNVGTLEEQEQALSILFIAAEELVSLYMRSGFYHTMLDEIKLVLDQSEFVYFHVDQDLSTPAFDVRLDVQEQRKYIPTPDFLHDRRCHNEVLSC
ncbi:hypothetical protein HHL24_20625 [Paraburkholderia sp. RP-4-7]|uniref:Uncharacterized protein n=1 Tax=Paraburkholderia polaris TaxID=2728848 RepID=A0A848IKU9_9BURK|nr:hypothetical protein [Paraburkholderia polaris]NMM00334.1 hypothetical protein [Paraburkholderia polaris]